LQSKYLTERQRAGGSATQHGSQETSLFTIITNLLYFGTTAVELNYRLPAI